MINQLRRQDPNQGHVFPFTEQMPLLFTAFGNQPRHSGGIKVTGFRKGAFRQQLLDIFLSIFPQKAFADRRPVGLLGSVNQLPGDDIGRGLL